MASLQGQQFARPGLGGRGCMHETRGTRPGPGIEFEAMDLAKKHLVGEGKAILSTLFCDVAGECK